MSRPLPLWSHLDEVMQRCLGHACCAVLLDFDGTLAPIVPEPDAARPSPGMQMLLDTLARHPRYRLAIVSGRALDDLRRRVSGNDWYLAGNHGMEIEGPGGRFDHPEARRARPRIMALAQDLRGDLGHIPGAFVEDKGMTLSVHYRQVPAAYVSQVTDSVLKCTGPTVEAGILTLRAGKAVIEIRPNVPWDKGEAVRWIVERLSQEGAVGPLLSLYVGDDETDEDAFRAVASSGIGIVVGHDRSYSAAHYYVQSVDEVERFLRVLHES